MYTAALDEHSLTYIASCSGISSTILDVCTRPEYLKFLADFLGPDGVAWLLGVGFFLAATRRHQLTMISFSKEDSVLLVL